MKKKNLFRRICRFGTLCSLSCLPVFAACTDEAATGQPAEGPAICFDVGLSETWESGGFAPAAERADTRTGHGTDDTDSSGASARRSAASNMTVTVIDGIPPRIRTARPQTRGAQKVGNDTDPDNGVISFADAFGTDGFGVLGYASDDEGSNWRTYITNTQITNEDGDDYWEAAEGQACNWPGTWRNCQMRLFAYAPYNADAEDTDFTYSDGKMEIHYTNPEEAEGQKEFLVAATEAYESGNYLEEVPLTFTHTLTAVGFRFIFTRTGSASEGISKPLPVDITKIEIDGVSMNGTYSVTYDDSEDKATGEWLVSSESSGGSAMMTGFSDDPGTNFNDIEEYNGTKFTDGAMCWPAGLATPVDFFLMIPQTLSGTSLTLTVYFTTDGGNESSIEWYGEFTGPEWQPGTTYIYTIILDYFDMEE